MAISWPTAKGIDAAIRMMKSNKEKFLGVKIAPITENYFQEVEYDEIYGSQGMTRAHALDGEPALVKFPKVVKKKFSPAYFKEVHRIYESDILKLRQLGESDQQRITAQQMIAVGLDNLNGRLENRIEWMRWQALLTGGVSINENGINVEADYGIPSDNLNKAVSVSWETLASSKPIDDIMSVQQDFVGTGFRLGRIIMNGSTAQLLCLSDDTKSYYQGAGIEVRLMPGNIEESFLGLFPGVTIEVYDEGYEDEDGNFQKFIPDNKVVFMGQSMPGEIMDVVSVPSLHSANGEPQPGKFAFVINNSGQQEANPHYDIVAGIYCLPRVKRPEAVMVMDVTTTG